VVGGLLHGRLELMYDFFECSTVRLYHFGKGCRGFGFWFLVGLFSSKVDAVVEVGVGIITAAVATGVGVGVGSSISVDSDGVPGAINCCCGGKAGSSSSSSGVGCSGCVLGVASAVVVAESIVVVAGANCTVLLVDSVAC